MPVVFIGSKSKSRYQLKAYSPRFLEYITDRPGVWIARRDDIAQHWTSKFPYDASKAFGQTPVDPCGQIHIKE